MFGRRNNFERCPHKDVTFERNHDNQIVEASLSCPRTEDDGFVVDVRANEIDAEIISRSVSLITQLPGENIYSSPAAAQKHLGKSACAIACNGCEYATMNPIEVALRRRDIAIERQTVAELDEERLSAQLALREAQHNIDEITGRLDSAEQ